MKLEPTIKRYPLSSPQREIWFYQVLHPEVPLYNIGGYAQINGAIDPVLFESAVNLLVQRHEALRTVLIPGNEEMPMQTFLEDLPVTVPIHDFSGENLPRQSALAWMQKQFVQPFYLYEKPLFHFALLKIDENCFFEFAKFHHLIVDGWGISLITQSLAEIYTQLIQGQKIARFAPSYLAFVKNDRAYIESKRYEVQRKYWLEKYQTLPESLFAPRYLSRFADRIPPSERRVLWLPRPLYNRLLAFAKNTRSTLFHVMLGALYVNFTRTTQREELAIGLPILNRSNASFKKTVGLFIGVCAAWFHFGTTLSFRQLLKAIGNELKSDYRHQRLPISELNRALGIRKMGRMQLFDIRLNYAKHDHDTEFGRFKAKAITLTNNNEQTPLTISVWELHKNEDVQVDFVYNLAYFDAPEVEGIQSRFVMILEYVLDHVDESIGTIPLLTKADQQQLLAWNQTESDYPKDQTIVDLFQDQVEKTPDHIAVSFEEQALSYQALNKKANQWAHYLMTLGVGAESLVGICVVRSLEMVIGLLGILKAGGAYVPLDPSYPLSRLQFMLEDSSAPILLSQSHLLERFPGSTAKKVCSDSHREQFASDPGGNPVRQSWPENLVYVIYTSGSTGRPKGVAMLHGALYNLIWWQIDYAELHSSARTLQFTSLNFDASFQEIFNTWSTGGNLVLISEETRRDPTALFNYLYQHKIERLYLPFVALDHLARAAEQSEPLFLKDILTAGEQLKVTSALNHFFVKNSGCRLHNLYGPTESHVVTSYLLPKEVAGWTELPPIGEPIANTQIYILDGQQNPTPPGIPGELCIAGAVLARGYLNRPELTAEKFCLRRPGGLFSRKPPPWTPRKSFLLEGVPGKGNYMSYESHMSYISYLKVPGKNHMQSCNHAAMQYHSPSPQYPSTPLHHSPIYHTGDLARWLPDGNLEFLGRLDHQVKLRGFRIELSEIEVTLSRHQAVKEAVVVLYNQDTNPRLVAYVTLAVPINEVSEVLRPWLKTRLPEYMLPSSFTVLDKLPLTSNGKIDRKALPAPDLSIKVEQQAPQTETQQLLCSLWSQVLGIEVTSINSHFFAAGGHSLLATRLVSRIRENFGIEMPLRVVFEQAILREQAEWLDKQQRGTELPPIMPLAEGAPLVLSFAQQRLWFLAHLEGQSTVYNMPAALHLEGQLDETALKQALTTLIQRHDSLRLCFPEVHGEATVQLNDVYNPLSVTDLSELSETEQQHQVTKWIANHAQTPFNLSTGPLLSLRLLKLGKQEQVLLFNMHHIISDGWSMGVLIREWSQLYNAYAQNQVPQFPKLPIQYTDYAAWQRNWLEGEILEQQLGYWIEKLAGAPELLEIPTDYPRPAVMRYQGKHLQSTLDQELTRGIKLLSRQQGVTVFMTLLAAFKVLLYRYSGQTDLVVGSPIANRTHHQTEDLIGFFVNTLVLRTQINGEQTFAGLLKQVRQTALEAYSHQDIPFEYLVEQLNPSRSLSHSPLFQVMLVLQNMPQEALELSGLKMSLLEPEHTTAKFDLTLSVAEHGEVIICDWEYCTDLFCPGTVTRMSEHFQVLLEGIFNNAGQALHRLPLLTEAEQQQLLVWNQTENDYPKDQTIVDLFQGQVEKTPDHIAVVFEGQALSYQVLNTKANRLAHYLMTLGVGAETLVGLCVERSLDMVIGLLGILKAGGVYVPLDPDYPLSRLQFMLEDSSAPVLLSQSHLLERFPGSTAKKVCLDSQWEHIAAYPRENPVRQSGPENLAYVIYTSGSTGVPNGVKVEYSGLINLVYWHNRQFAVTQLDKATLFASIAFDASSWELWPYLSAGACICPVKPEIVISSGAALKAWLDEKQITITFLPTSLVENFIAETWQTTTLRIILTGGDALHTYLSSKCYFKLYNNYGPTENTVVTTSGEVPFATNSHKPTFPSIGRPIANTRIYILDANHNPTPLGIPGELCIAGVGLARGYLNRPELTAEKFKRAVISSPSKLSTNDQCPMTNDRSHKYSPNDRLYHTGDLARWLLDGNLEFLGRLDRQVKLRGFRIELSEIEVTLSRHEAVKEAVVVVYNQEDNPRLVAYVTLAMPINEVSEVLRSWLKTRLPEYMLPTSFTVLDKLPLTSNGKIDRKALPAPDLSIKAEQQTPQTETQHLLCSLWSQVLGIEVTSINSHFFAAGGHSLLATRLVSRIRESFGIEMPLRVVFEQAILREQAEWLDKQQRGSRLPPIMPLAEGAPLVLSFAQQRLWFLAYLEGQNAAYNIPAALHLEGQLDETALQQALTTLVQRHRSLRLCFPMVDGKAAVQLNDVYNPLSVTHLSDLPETGQQKEVTGWIARHAQTPFDLSTGPLLSMHLLKLGKQEHILLFNMHHIISDGWSMGVLIREWSHLYSAYAQNQAPQLPKLPVQYTDYAAWQRSWLQGEVLDRQLAYWTEKLTGAPELLELPTDYPRPAVMSYQGKQLKSTLAKELTREIKQLSRQQGVTVFMTLLAAFKVLLSRYSGQTDLVVGSPIANRTHHQTEDLIGFFVNTLVLRTQINGEQTFRELLKQVRQTALEAYSHQDIPFEYLVEQVNPSRSLSHSPLFQVMLVLQNAPEESLELSGLKMSFLEPEHTTAKFDLTLSISEQGGVFVCDWEYCTDLFRPGTITRMCEHFRVLLEGILNNAGQALHRLPLLTEADQQQLLAWNQTETDYPKDQTIVDLFQAQVEKTPDHIAVVFEGQALSYQALNRKANRLAHYLMSLGVGAETLVGLCTERSLEMMIGLLGILKAGGAYVPLDPDYPLSRLHFMSEDSSVPVLLSQQHLLEKLPDTQEHGAKVVCLDSQWESTAGGSGENPGKQSRLENLAYVMYTSGSTGRPKGVVLPDGALYNLICWHVDHAELHSPARTLQFTSLNFDVSFQEIFSTWSTGGNLVLIPEKNRRDPTALFHYLYQHQVERLYMPFVALDHLARTAEQSEPLFLKDIITAGEQLKVTSALKNFFVKHSGSRLHNHYGPTESHVVTSYLLPKEAAGWLELPPIGGPIANTRIYIIDANLNPTPPGIPGELCIAGAGLARGYLNRPELTAEKFCLRRPGGLFSRKPPPWTPRKSFLLEGVSGKGNYMSYESHMSYISYLKVPGKNHMQSPPHQSPYYPITPLPHFPIYHTGDLARWLPDGNIEFLGRLDYQVKLRGFRIELGEIEAVLGEHPAVRDNAVVVHETPKSDKRLVAYLVPRQGQSIDNTRLRAFLTKHLPDYMIPSVFVSLDTLPLTPSGKVNRRTLSRLPIIGHKLSGKEFTAPRTTEEKLLAGIWKEVLEIEQVGIHDNFFELGGHSFNALSLLAKMNRAGFPVTLSDIYHYQTISELSRYIIRLKQKIQLEDTENPSETDLLTQLDLKEFNEENIHAIESRLQEDYKHNNTLLKQGNVSKEYLLAPMQQLQIAFRTPVSADVFLLDEYVDEALFKQAYQQVIKQQGLLRSIAINKKGRFYWQEYRYNPACSPGITVIDLAEYNVPFEILLKLYKKLRQKIFEVGDIYYHTIMIRNNLRENYILTLFNHVIFDRATGEILKRQLLTAYYSLLEDQAVEVDDVESYEAYVSQVFKGPQGITEQEVIKRFHLEDFFRDKQQLLELMHPKKIGHTTYTFLINVPLQEERKGKQALGIALSIYGRALQRYTGVDKIPLLFVYEGRQYGDMLYYNTIGEFIDMVPMVLDPTLTPEELLHSFQERLDYLKRYNINFLNLVLNKDFSGECNRTAALINHGKNFETVDIMMFNFLGNAEDNLGDYKDEVRQEPNPLPINTMFNCITSNYKEGLLFSIRCSYEVNYKKLKDLFHQAVEDL